MQTVLEKGANFRFTARGFSMSPFIMDNDIITVSPVKISVLSVGDVAVVENDHSCSVIVHRIVRIKNNCFHFKGDNCLTHDGAFSPKSIKGIVSTVERDGKKVWFGKGVEKKVIAFMSGVGILRLVIRSLTLLRLIKS